MTYDFSDFDRKIHLVLGEVTDVEKEAIKRRIAQELDTLESNPEVYESFQVTRDRIRAIEEKALRKVGKSVPVLKREGRRCSLCSRYESDVDVMINLGDKHSVCSESILLVKEVLDEAKEN